MTESSAQWSLSFPFSKLIICLNYALLKSSRLPSAPVAALALSQQVSTLQHRK